MLFRRIALLVVRVFRIFKKQKKDTLERFTPPAKTKAQNERLIWEQIPRLPTAKVKWVIDGDTVIVIKSRKEITIRLDSIDCPEDGQEWGDIATYALIKLIGGKTVRLEEHGYDDYGRVLATIYIWSEYKKKNDWLNVNERMVVLGHAWVMRMFYDHLPFDRQDKLNRLEGWARSRRMGLWQKEDPTPPWFWRNNKD